MRLAFRILGPLEADGGPGPVALGGPKQRMLLALLLLHANEVVSRDRIVDALWPEADPQAAQRSLTVYVSALRKALGPAGERVRTRPGGYLLAVEPDELDADRFERAVAEGGAAVAGGDPARAAETLRAALSLWRGRALGELAYEPFAASACARLEELRLGALEERIEADLALGRHREVVGELEALAAAEPVRERLHAQLMLALYQSGRQAEALDVFDRARRSLRDELGLEPGPALRELQTAILRHEPGLRVEPPELRARRHLPAPATPLVGRRREVEDVGALVRREGARLVTLTGPGGIGKTRIALQAAHELADAFDGGVWFAGLAALREPELVPSTLVRALGLDERAGEPREVLARHLAGRRVLLVVDSFEVVDEAAPVLAELLAAAPGLALLVSSRAPLRLAAEHELRIAPLAPADAARLFVLRAAAVAPAHRRPSEDDEAVGELCRRLDRLPLAIELAAARSRELTPEEMLAVLPLELASRGPRDLPARQQTLRAAIGWSYELLPAAEQDVFARLGVFAGGCTLPAASEVAGAGRSDLFSLVDRSLVAEQPAPGADRRFAMLDLVREYACELLVRRGDGEEVRRRHALHYAALAEAEGLGLPDAELANVRAALSFCRESGEVELELRLAAAVARVWEVRGYLHEGHAALDGALARGAAAPARLRVKALVGAGALALGRGDYAAMQAVGEERLALCRALGDEAGVARALDNIATAVANQGDLDGAMGLYEESVGICRRIGDLRGLGSAITNLGCLALMQGDLERATVLSEEGLALYGELGEADRMHNPRFNLGLAALLQHRRADAFGHFRDGLELAREAGYAQGSIYSLEGAAAVLAAEGECDPAARLLGAAEAASEATGVTLEPLERGIHDRTVETVRAALGEAAFAAAHAAGRELELDEASAAALGYQVSQRTTPSSGRRGPGRKSVPRV